MDDVFREYLAAMREATQKIATAHEHIAQASQTLAEANTGMANAVDAALRANEEQEDLRETVRRLEGLVMELLRRQGPATS